MIRVFQDDEKTLHIRCNYAKDYINRLRSIGAEAKKNDNKWYWKLPVNKFDKLEEIFYGELVYETPRHVILGQPKPPLPNSVTKHSESPLPLLLPLELKPHQNQAVRFVEESLTNQHFALIQDSVGLGKTATSLASTEFLCSKDMLKYPILIICLASLKEQWLNEGVYKFTNRKGIIIHGTPKKREKIYEEWKEYDYFIINYDLLKNDMTYLQSIPFELMIIDEPHEKILNPAGKTNNLVRMLGIQKKIFLTATPLSNSPLELFGLFKVADDSLLGTRTAFEKRYIRQDYSKGYPKLIGYRHLDELRNLLASYSIRRTRADLTLPFPEITRIVRRIKPNSKQTKAFSKLSDYKSYLQDRFETLHEKPDKTEYDYKELDSLHQRIQSLTLYGLLISSSPQMLVNAKNKFIKKNIGPILDKCTCPKMDLFMDLMAQSKGEKVIVFTQFRRVAVQLHELIEKQIGQSVLYVGNMTSEERQAAKDSFNKDPDTVALIGTSAAYTGLNLPSASIVIHYDMPWNQTRLEQREGRATRLDSVHQEIPSYILITEQLLDDKVYDTIQEKGAVFDFLVS